MNLVLTYFTLTCYVLIWAAICSERAYKFHLRLEKEILSKTNLSVHVTEIPQVLNNLFSILGVGVLLMFFQFSPLEIMLPKAAELYLFFPLAFLAQAALSKTFQQLLSLYHPQYQLYNNFVLLPWISQNSQKKSIYSGMMMRILCDTCFFIISLFCLLILEDTKTPPIQHIIYITALFAVHQFVMVCNTSLWFAISRLAIVIFIPSGILFVLTGNLIFTVLLNFFGTLLYAKACFNMISDAQSANRTA